MKVKLDSYYLNVLIKGLYTQRTNYDEETNSNIDTLLLRLVDESDKLKLSRKKKIVFQPDEIKLIRTCLSDWRNEQIQAEKEDAVEVISELLEKFI
ncbi:MAG: hypothetical protein PHI27_11005 [Eubacteriales bacterium]|nr:hypothetical protein [Eubacteriales bacterium]MDD4512968.1 hypothetical protein [Eubacteriales bacterium]